MEVGYVGTQGGTCKSAPRRSVYRNKWLVWSTPILTYFFNYFQSTSKQAAIIENPTPSNASTSNYTPSTTSDSALPTHEEQDLPGPSSYDEYQIFGEYVANELRNMNYLKYKGELKRKIQRLIIEYTEKDENEYLANTNFESPAATYSALEGPTSKAASTEEPSTSQDLYMDSKDDIVKIEILDPLPEDEWIQVPI